MVLGGRGAGEGWSNFEVGFGASEPGITGRDIPDYVYQARSRRYAHGKPRERQNESWEEAVGVAGLIRWAEDYLGSNGMDNGRGSGARRRGSRENRRKSKQSSLCEICIIQTKLRCFFFFKKKKRATWPAISLIFFNPPSSQYEIECGIAWCICRGASMFVMQWDSTE